MRTSRGYKIFTAVNVVVLLGVVFLTLYPFVNIIAQSLSSESAIVSGRVNLLPIGFNVDTYKVVMSDRLFWLNYRNTVVYTIVATMISLVLTTMYAYAISRTRLRGRGLFIGIAVFTMFFNGGMIPNYILISSLGMMNTMWAIVIPNAVSIFNLLVMKAFFENMPLELEEAAAIDGLTTYGILLRVVMPLSKAILATMLLFYAVAHWNSWFQAFLYLSDKELFPVTMYLRNMIAGTSQTSDVAAASADAQTQISSNIKAVTMVLTVLPILCVYPFVQRYFVSGVMLGSVKQ
ncbi:sugar ABC transporter permease [Brachybacterium ginsengisoli]|uniref:Sugar ABC transporter permease n=1 Tax=Brachybacterium ginsengisoli TaxID=1331682 RepID=A0A291H1E1_9MICO|nr:carbohydrate ABC transporter permease [Brachybacterium ginsengisoli]ATG56184.1 sugar ABC transporter permease [Brachybacterium ginsengisoli]